MLFSKIKFPRNFLNLQCLILLQIMVCKDEEDNMGNFNDVNRSLAVNIDVTGPLPGAEKII